MIAEAGPPEDGVRVVPHESIRMAVEHTARVDLCSVIHHTILQNKDVVRNPQCLLQEPVGHESTQDHDMHICNSLADSQ